MKDEHIVLLNEKLAFLIEDGFKPLVIDDCYSLVKDELCISFCFAYSFNEVVCTLCQNSKRLTLLELVEYFGIQAAGFYYMYSSLSEIPMLIEQYALLIETLVKKHQIFDRDVFENVVLYYLIMYNVMKNNERIQSQISLANRRFNSEDYYWAGKIYLEYYRFLKKSEKIKLSICKEKCHLLA